MIVGAWANVAAAGVLLVSLAIAACSDAGSGNPRAAGATPTPVARRHHSRLDSTHASGALKAAAARAEAAINVPGEIVGVYGVLASPGSSLGAPITTDGGVRVGPGRYLLAFACVGTGQVDAEIWVRKASAKVRATCQRRPELGQLDLTAHQAGPVYVQFAATQREIVAIAGWAASR